MNNLSTRLETSLAAADQTARSLANAIGISGAAISQWRTGQTKSINSEYLHRAAEFLGVNSQWLATGEGDMRLAEAGSNRRGTVDIPLLSVRASMGSGYGDQENSDIVSFMKVDVHELRRLMSFSASINLRLLSAHGDSMQPTIKDGDVLMVDIGVTELKLDAIYILSRNDELFCKRIQRKASGGFRMISDNTIYHPEDINPERDGFTVLGRVLCVWGFAKL